MAYGRDSVSAGVTESHFYLRVVETGLSMADVHLKHSRPPLATLCEHQRTTNSANIFKYFP